MKLPKNLGMLLLAVWLILFGLVYWPLVSFTYQTAVLALLAIVVGVLLLLQR
jgi:hypothetical protein